MQRNKHFKVNYVVGSPLELSGFTDSYWVVDSIDINSTSGYVFMLSHGPICWSSKKHHTVSLSSTEAEYRGTMNATT